MMNAYPLLEMCQLSMADTSWTSCVFRESKLVLFQAWGPGPDAEIGNCTLA